MVAANPHPSVKEDTEYASNILAAIKNPIVLVSHSYGGSAITEAGYGNAMVKAVVHVSALAPHAGERAVAFSSKFPGATQASAPAAPVPLSGGGNNLNIQHDKFAADTPNTEAKLIEVTRRPITEATPNEVPTASTWKSIPSWCIYGDKVKNMLSQAEHFMA